MLLELGEGVEMLAAGLAFEVLALPLLLRLRRTVSNFAMLHQLLLASKRGPAGLTFALGDQVDRRGKLRRGIIALTLRVKKPV
jgi:hypothetical protein